mgnify:CR=1 FL=1
MLSVNLNTFYLYKIKVTDYDNDDITYEHIIPRCHGGETSYKNGKVVHLSCNNYIGILPKERKMNMFVHWHLSQYLQNKMCMMFINNLKLK